MLTQALKTDRRITPAGEWLLDNFFLIEEQIRTARRHLPKGYSRELPRLLNSPSDGIPRVYDLALETISHGDGRVDPENLSNLVAAYQTVSVLKLGELWAIPIMLRLALIENLRRITARIAADRLDRNLADYWADQMTETRPQRREQAMKVTADTITDEQILELRDNAVRAGDGNTVRMAVLALGYNGYFEGWDCRVAHGHERMTIDMARCRCAYILNTRNEGSPKIDAMGDNHAGR